MIQTKSKEEKACFEMAMEIMAKFNCDCNFAKHNNNNYLYLCNPYIDILLTTCETNTKQCVKVEEVLIKEEYRNKGLGTELYNTMKSIALKFDVNLGLWCDLDNNRLFNYYTRLGFKHIETLNDKWLEFN